MEVFGGFLVVRILFLVVKTSVYYYILKIFVKIMIKYPLTGPYSSCNFSTHGPPTVCTFNISRFILNRGLIKWSCNLAVEECTLPGGMVNSYIFLPILGAIAAPFNVFDCLIGKFIGSTDYNKESSNTSPS